MKTFSKIAVLAAFVATSAFAAVPASASAATAPQCKAVAVGTKNSTQGSSAIFHVNGNKVSASYKLTGPKNCKLTMQLISWEAPNPTNGMPYSAQKEIDRTTKTAGPGTYTLTAKFPDCYYQLDLVFKGGEKYSVRNIGYAHGGDHKCGTKPVKHTPQPPTSNTTTTLTPTTPQATPTTVAVTPAAATTKELPHTGPEATLGMFMGVSGAGTLVHRYVSRKARRA